MTEMRVSRLRADLERLDKYRDKLLGKEFVAAHLDDPHVRGTHQTGYSAFSRGGLCIAPRSSS
jgi:hypothetical protein